MTVAIYGMNKSAPRALDDDTESAKPETKPYTGLLTSTLRFLSATTLALAFSSAIVLIAVRLVHWYRPQFLPSTLKSAYPLILVGIAFACMQFTSPRTRTQTVLGLAVALA